MVNAKQKGKRVELEIVHWLRERGYSSARRTQQFNGAEGSSDITDADKLSDWHIECKGTKSNVRLRSELLKWTEQVHRDIEGTCLKPVILNKSNGCKLLAILPWRTWLELEGQTNWFTCVSVDPSINPYTELAKLRMTANVMFATDKAPPAEHVAIFYGLTDEDVLVLMDAEAWIMLLTKSKSSSDNP